jgi:PhnB protein
VLNKISQISHPAKHYDNASLRCGLRNDDSKVIFSYYLFVFNFSIEKLRIKLFSEHLRQQSNIMENHSPAFAPMLYLKNLATAVEFYKKAFDATELRLTTNPDGSVHVAEMTIAKAWFRMHEEVLRDNELSPSTLGGTTVVLGLLVDDPDAVAKKAVAAGGIELSPVQDYDYGFRQGTVRDPFGHHWLIEKDTRK